MSFAKNFGSTHRLAMSVCNHSRRTGIGASRNLDSLPGTLGGGIIRLKDEGRVLMRFNELRETLPLRLSGEFKRFAVSHPGRAKDNSPAIHRWVSGREGERVPAGTKECFPLHAISFAPTGLGRDRWPLSQR